MDIRATLKNHQLKVTESRFKVLAMFSSQNEATSYQDILQALPKNFDRVTLYRILKSFEQKGIIHKVIDHNDNALYALCKDKCSEAGHEHNHIHFKCWGCEKSFCVEQQNFPSFTLPTGYNPQKINVLFEGYCPDCNAN